MASSQESSVNGQNAKGEAPRDPLTVDLHVSEDQEHELNEDGTYFCWIARQAGPTLFFNAKITRALCIYCLGTVAER